MRDTSAFHHLKLYLKLKQQEYIIEKSIEGFIANCKVDSVFLPSIKQDLDKFQREWKKDENALKETIQNIYDELKSVRSVILKKDFEKIDLKIFKNRLQSLWKQIEEFKNSCNHNIEKLSGEKHNLDAEINTLMRSISKHKTLSVTDARSCKITNFKGPSQKDSSTKECDYEEIEDFCTLLAKTGHSGNWAEEDHLLFLKLRKKHKTIPTLVHAIQAKCPDLTKESIINHEAWYKTYIKLREKQKIAVQEWRKRKESERRTKIAATPEIRKNEAHRDGNIRGKSPLAGATTDRSHQSTEPTKEDVEKKKEMVKQWREQKEKIRAAEEERLKDHIKARRELKENRRQARAKKLKKLVAEYKEKKLVEKNEGHDKCDYSNKPSAVPDLILQFYRARDLQFVEKRRSILSSIKNKPIQRAKTIQHDVIKTKESTLFKETKAWQERLKRVEPKTVSTLSYIKDLPERAMASWKSYEISDSFSHRQR